MFVQVEIGKKGDLFGAEMTFDVPNGGLIWIDDKGVMHKKPPHVGSGWQYAILCGGDIEVGDCVFGSRDAPHILWNEKVVFEDES